MLLFEYAPVAPWSCLVLALLAVPIALLIRRFSPATRRWWLPRAWSPRHAMTVALIGVLALLAALMAGPVLEWATGRLLVGAGMGEDLGDAATWTAAAAALEVWLSLQAWRLLLLTWPLLFALGRVAELRWTRAPAVILTLTAATPLFGAAIVAAFPPFTPANGLAAAALLWTLPLHFALAFWAFRQARARFHAWRAAPSGETTRISPMPAALAASLEVGEGRTTGFVRVRRQSL